MTGKKSKIGAMVVAAAASLTLGVGVAHSAHASGSTPFSTDTDDNLTPASTAVTGTSHKTVFSVAAGAIVVTCTLSKAKATTPATGLGPVNLTSPPTFTDGGNPPAPCTDNLGATDTTATSGTWTLKFVDAPNDETGTEPNATGDKMQIVVPQGGAVVTNSLGCTITVAPNGPFTVTGKYDDTSKLHVSITNLPISVAGGPQCPTNATTSTFQGTYTFSPGVHDGS